jgi:hypothetical protein
LSIQIDYIKTISSAALGFSYVILSTFLCILIKSNKGESTLNRKLFFLILLTLGFTAFSGSIIILQSPDEVRMVETEIQSGTPDQPTTVDLPIQLNKLDKSLFRQLSELYESFSQHSSDLWKSDYRFDKEDEYGHGDWV